MLELIWGHKTTAFLDVWTFEHILWGMSVGNSVNKNNLRIFKKNFDLDPRLIATQYYDFIALLYIAYAWETAEHYLETGLAGITVEYWFQGVEFWGNRMLMDPLAVILGYIIVKKYPRLVMPARGASVAWLAVHVFVFPHSMYLHTFF